MGKSLSKSLSQFITNTNDSFDNPFDDGNDSVEASSTDTRFIIESSEEIEKPKKEKKKKGNKYDRVISKGNDMLTNFLDDNVIDDFDGFLGEFLLDDEDVELRRNLIRQGRKYARETQVSAETSEISKAYSESEKLLHDLLKEIDSDKELVQKDISNMRMMRTRNYKTLSDLIESKAQFHNTALSVIKEMNAMKKNQFELQMKVDRSKKEDAADDSAANRAIQQLFSMDRGSLMNGYEDISGSVEAGTYDDDDFSSLVDEDEIIQKKYFDNDTEISDGDKFLQYEGRGVHYILLYDDNNYREIIAEDNEGNLIPDYPMPGEPDELEFDFSVATGSATDNLANHYELRHI